MPILPGSGFVDIRVLSFLASNEPISLHFFVRRQPHSGTETELYFIIREIDLKILRPRDVTRLNNQQQEKSEAANRLIINSVCTDNVAATNEEIKALKALGLLSVRVPKVALISPATLIKLLRHFDFDLRALVLESVLICLLTEFSVLSNTLMNLKNAVYAANNKFDLPHDNETSVQLLKEWHNEKFLEYQKRINLTQCSTAISPDGKIEVPYELRYPVEWNGEYDKNKAVPALSLRSAVELAEVLSNPTTTGSTQLWSTLINQPNLQPLSTNFKNPMNETELSMLMNKLSLQETNNLLHGPQNQLVDKSITNHTVATPSVNMVDVAIPMKGKGRGDSIINSGPITGTKCSLLHQEPITQASNDTTITTTTIDTTKASISSAKTTTTTTTTRTKSTKTTKSTQNLHNQQNQQNHQNSTGFIDHSKISSCPRINTNLKGAEPDIFAIDATIDPNYLKAFSGQTMPGDQICGAFVGCSGVNGDTLTELDKFGPVESLQPNTRRNGPAPKVVHTGNLYSSANNTKSSHRQNNVQVKSFISHEEDHTSMLLMYRTVDQRLGHNVLNDPQLNSKGFFGSSGKSGGISSKIPKPEPFEGVHLILHHPTSKIKPTRYFDSDVDEDDEFYQDEGIVLDVNPQNGDNNDEIPMSISTKRSLTKLSRNNKQYQLSKGVNSDPLHSVSTLVGLSKETAQHIRTQKFFERVEKQIPLDRASIRTQILYPGINNDPLQNLSTISSYIQFHFISFTTSFLPLQFLPQVPILRNSSTIRLYGQYPAQFSFDLTPQLTPDDAELIQSLEDVGKSAHTSSTMGGKTGKAIPYDSEDPNSMYAITPQQEYSIKNSYIQSRAALEFIRILTVKISMRQKNNNANNNNNNVNNGPNTNQKDNNNNSSQESSPSTEESTGCPHEISIEYPHLPPNGLPSYGLPSSQESEGLGCESSQQSEGSGCHDCHCNDTTSHHKEHQHHHNHHHHHNHRNDKENNQSDSGSEEEEETLTLFTNHCGASQYPVFSSEIENDNNPNPWPLSSYGTTIVPDHKNKDNKDNKDGNVAWDGDDLLMSPHANSPSTYLESTTRSNRKKKLKYTNTSVITQEPAAEAQVVLVNNHAVTSCVPNSKIGDAFKKKTVCESCRIYAVNYLRALPVHPKDLANGYKDIVTICLCDVPKHLKRRNFMRDVYYPYYHSKLLHPSLRRWGDILEAGLDNDGNEQLPVESIQDLCPIAPKGKIIPYQEQLNISDPLSLTMGGVVPFSTLYSLATIYYRHQYPFEEFIKHSRVCVVNGQIAPVSIKFQQYLSYINYRAFAWLLSLQQPVVYSFTIIEFDAETTASFYPKNKIPDAWLMNDTPPPIQALPTPVPSPLSPLSSGQLPDEGTTPKSPKLSEEEMLAALFAQHNHLNITTIADSITSKLDLTLDKPTRQGELITTNKQSTVNTTGGKSKKVSQKTLYSTQDTPSFPYSITRADLPLWRSLLYHIEQTLEPLHQLRMMRMAMNLTTLHPNERVLSPSGLDSNSSIASTTSIATINGGANAKMRLPTGQSKMVIDNDDVSDGDDDNTFTQTNQDLTGTKSVGTKSTRGSTRLQNNLSAHTPVSINNTTATTTATTSSPVHNINENDNNKNSIYTNALNTSVTDNTMMTSVAPKAMNPNDIVSLSCEEMHTSDGLNSINVMMSGGKYRSREEYRNAHQDEFAHVASLDEDDVKMGHNNNNNTNNHNHNILIPPQYLDNPSQSSHDNANVNPQFNQRGNSREFYTGADYGEVYQSKLGPEQLNDLPLFRRFVQHQSLLSTPNPSSHSSAQFSTVSSQQQYSHVEMRGKTGYNEGQHDLMRQTTNDSVTSTISTTNDAQDEAQTQGDRQENVQYHSLRRHSTAISANKNAKKSKQPRGRKTIDFHLQKLQSGEITFDQLPSWVKQKIGTGPDNATGGNDGDNIQNNNGDDDDGNSNEQFDEQPQQQQPPDQQQQFDNSSFNLSQSQYQQYTQQQSQYQYQSRGKTSGNYYHHSQMQIQTDQNQMHSHFGLSEEGHRSNLNEFLELIHYQDSEHSTMTLNDRASPLSGSYFNPSSSGSNGSTPQYTPQYQLFDSTHQLRQSSSIQGGFFSDDSAVQVRSGEDGYYSMVNSGSLSVMLHGNNNDNNSYNRMNNQHEHFPNTTPQFDPRLMEDDINPVVLLPSATPLVGAAPGDANMMKGLPQQSSGTTLFQPSALDFNMSTINGMNDYYNNTTSLSNNNSNGAFSPSQTSLFENPIQLNLTPPFNPMGNTDGLSIKIELLSPIQHTNTVNGRID